MNNKTKLIVSVGVFSALSLVLYYLRFPLPIFPSILKVQFSNLPLVICGFCYGLKYSIIALVIKTIIGIFISFGSSMAIGEMADLIIGIAYLIVTAIIYNKNKTKKTGLKALIFGTLTWVITACVLNYFVLVPVYISIYFKGSVEAFVGVCSIIPGITITNYKVMYVLVAALPFNLILSLCVSLVTFLVYKRISNFLKSDN